MLYRRAALSIYRINKGALSDKNSSDKIVEISACRKFCPTKIWSDEKNCVRRKFCPMFQYKSQAKIGQNRRNFGLVSKILFDQIFCPTKIFSDELLSDKIWLIHNASIIALLCSQILLKGAGVLRLPDMGMWMIVMTADMRVFAELGFFSCG